jgi:hypothetical protein
MQTVAWMAFSDSTHFSDKLSYKIHFISSYHLKDMIYTRFEYLQEYSKNSKLETETGLDLSSNGDE